MKHAYSSLAMALEEEGEVVNPEEGVGEVAPEEGSPEAALVETDIPAETLETELLEAKDAEDTVVTDDEYAEDVGEALEDLGKIEDQLEESLQNGGIAPETAEMMEVAVECICARIGMTRARLFKNLPAMEAYDGPAGKLKATKIALEDIKDKAKKMWDTIIAWLKKAYAQVLQWFTTLFDGAAKTVKRSKKIGEAAAKAEGQPKAQVIESASMFKKLQIGGKIDKAGGDLANSAATIKQFFDAARTYDVVSPMLKVIDGLKSGRKGGDLESASGEVQKTIEQFAGKAFSAKASKEANGVVSRSTEEMMGGVGIWIDYPKEAEGGKTRIYIAPVNQKVYESVKETKVPVLTPDGCAAVAKSMEEIGEYVQGLKKLTSEIKSDNDKLVSAANSLKNIRLDGEEGGEGKAAFRKAQGYIQTAGALLTTPKAKVAQLSLQMAKTAGDHASASLKMYGVAPKGEEAGEDKGGKKE